MNAFLPQTYLLGLIGLLAIVAVVGGRQFLRVRRDEQSLLKMEQAKVASSKDAGALYELASVQLRKRLYPQAIVTLRQAVKRLNDEPNEARALIENALGYALAKGNNVSLLTLNLDYNKDIGSFGLQQLARGLRTNISLRKISMQYCNIESDAGAAIGA